MLLLAHRLERTKSVQDLQQQELLDSIRIPRRRFQDPLLYIHISFVVMLNKNRTQKESTVWPRQDRERCQLGDHAKVCDT